MGLTTPPHTTPGPPTTEGLADPFGPLWGQGSHQVKVKPGTSETPRHLGSGLALWPQMQMSAGPTSQEGLGGHPFPPFPAMGNRGAWRLLVLPRVPTEAL